MQVSREETGGPGTGRPGVSESPVVHLDAGCWSVSCAPEHGARLTRLRVAGRDLLTRAPNGFRPPARDFGRYETRPVYGYDDCFPTVDPCRLPGGGPALPDHGEICWLPWEVTTGPERLCCSARSRMLPLRFTRTMDFEGCTLRWSFSVENQGPAPLPFLHVMHALMPLQTVRALELPPCAEVIDETTGAPACAPSDVAAWLLARPAGTASMILLRGIEEGLATVFLDDGIGLEIRFPNARFPTLAIWWNHGGHPPGEASARYECAFEPLAGPWSSLERSHSEGRTQQVAARGRAEWKVAWRMRGLSP